MITSDLGSVRMLLDATETPVFLSLLFASIFRIILNVNNQFSDWQL